MKTCQYDGEAGMTIIYAKKRFGLSWRIEWALPSTSLGTVEPGCRNNVPLDAGKPRLGGSFRESMERGSVERSKNVGR